MRANFNKARRVEVKAAADKMKQCLSVAANKRRFLQLWTLLLVATVSGLLLISLTMSNLTVLYEEVRISSFKSVTNEVHLCFTMTRIRYSISRQKI